MKVWTGLLLAATTATLAEASELQSIIQQHIEPIRTIGTALAINESGIISLTHKSTAIKSGTTNPIDPPVLTGSEYFDLALVRSRLEANHPTSPYTTAQSVRDFSNESYQFQLGIAGRLLFREIGRTLLTLNWMNTVVLGRRDEALTLQAELQALREEDAETENLVSQLVTAIDNGDELAAFGSFFSFDNDHSAAAFMTARYISSLPALLPDAADPEGFLRQTLQGARANLEDLGQVFRSWDR